MLLFFGFDTGDLQVWLDRAGPWAPIAFIFAGIASMSVLVPKTAVSITAGALFGTAIGSLLMLVIAVVAAALNYAIGRWWLFESIDERLRDASRNDRAMWLRAVRDVAAQAGFQFHFLIRLAPVPTTLISYAMGASGSRIRPFLAAAAVAVIPQTLWVHGGTAATLVADQDRSVLRWTGIVVSVLAAAAISVIIPRMAVRRVAAMKRMQASGVFE